MTQLTCRDLSGACLWIHPRLWRWCIERCWWQQDVRIQKCDFNLDEHFCVVHTVPQSDNQSVGIGPWNRRSCWKKNCLQWRAGRVLFYLMSAFPHIPLFKAPTIYLYLFKVNWFSFFMNHYFAVCGVFRWACRFAQWSLQMEPHCGVRQQSISHKATFYVNRGENLNCIPRTTLCTRKNTLIVNLNRKV